MKNKKKNLLLFFYFDENTFIRFTIRHKLISLLSEDHKQRSFPTMHDSIR